jgi:hypothetical protein
VATTTNASRFTRGKDRFYDIDGQMLPSVTTVLACLAKPALINWAAKLTRERMCDEAAKLYAETHVNGTLLPADWFRSSLWSRVEKRVFQNEESRAAADLGTVAHARCEWLVQKRLGRPVGLDPLGTEAERLGLKPPEIDRALWASLAFEDWMVKNDVRPIATEIVVAHRGHGFAGTADLVASVNGRVSLIDLKTSSGLWSEMFMQVAAYRAAYNEGVLSGVEDIGRDDPQGEALTAHLVRLPKKINDADFEAVEVTNLDAHLSAFLALLEVWKWQTGVGR